MRVEITEQQYRELSGTGVDVECKFYLVVNSAKTQTKCKASKRRSGLSLVRVSADSDKIALTTQAQEDWFISCIDVMGRQAMPSAVLSERLSSALSISKDNAATRVSTLIKAGVLTVD